ncbi:hypothetical protein BX266_2056 [Streptomyces sp. TLI_171]|nr:hypothetical protein BX266_2056 [Streptomyces sp. TLI_171]
MLVRAFAEHPGRIRAVDPSVGLSDLLARHEAELVERQATLAASRAAVTRMVADRAERRSEHGERLLGMDAILHRLERMGRETTREVISIQPGNQRPEDLDASRPSGARVLARGIAVRTLYQDSARHQPHTVTYSHWLRSRGGEVRTSPTVPQRIVVDLREALVPVCKGTPYVTEPGILPSLLDLFDLFDQVWNTAVPLGSTTPEDPSTGLTDDAAGQRLALLLPHRRPAHGLHHGTPQRQQPLRSRHQGRPARLALTSSPQAFGRAPGELPRPRSTHGPGRTANDQRQTGRRRTLPERPPELGRPWPTRRRSALLAASPPQGRPVCTGLRRSFLRGAFSQLRGM